MILFPQPPARDDEVVPWAQNLARVLQTLNNAEVVTIALEGLHVEPENLRDGMIARADGTDWDPGAGIGIYWYNASTSTWTKMG